MRVPFLRPNYLPMAALPSTITLGFGFQHSTFRIVRRQKHSAYLRPFYTVHLHICPQDLSSPNTTICLDRKWGDHQRGRGNMCSIISLTLSLICLHYEVRSSFWGLVTVHKSAFKAEIISFTRPFCPSGISWILPSTSYNVTLLN